MNEGLTIEEIISKYPDITQDEQIILDNWLAQDNNTELFQSLINKRYNEELQRIEHLKGLNETSWLKLNQKLAETSHTKVIWWQGWRMIAAACILSVLAVGGYMWHQSRSKNSVKQVEESMVMSKSDAEPGSFKAKLILSDGSSILLDTAISTELSQGSATIVNKQGQLVYTLNNDGNSYTRNETVYNTLETSKGQTFVTVLSDGTKIWLNSESSLKYPVIFSGSERKVIITGEAYFEVAKSFIARSDVGETKQDGGGKRPFIVQKGNLQVEVLGTHFNVNTYEEEGNIKVTLLEGSIKVSQLATHDSRLLKPNEQAIINDQKVQVKSDPNIEEVMAWKNGKFVFDNTSLEMIMRQIERWYDVDISYVGDIQQQDITLTGRISRYSSASKVLDLLQTTGMIHFTIDGKKIIVKN